MAEQNNEGVAYLKALKQSYDPATAAPPLGNAADQQLIGSAVETEDGGRVREKRRSFRYKCEGTAELRQDGRDVRIWATLRDVSLHGCYVEAQATYPVGAILHMKLEANGVQVETKGLVRVNYPYLGMGIAFHETSEAVGARLREMLNKISRRTVVMLRGIPFGTLPQLADPASALRALTKFFENRQILMRDEFIRILRKSQSSIPR
jgi:hypothetical protein